MRDKEIRMVLKRNIISSLRRASNSAIVDELGLRHGKGRIDIVLVNGALHGFEIKSTYDSLKRLPEQAAIYNSVLEKITLVIAECHLKNALKIVPKWWGIKIAKEGKRNNVILHNHRRATRNPTQQNHALAKLLWRDEALDLLEEVDSVNGFRSRPRAIIYSRLVEKTDLKKIRAKVCHQLQNRTSWRSGERQM